MYELAYSLIFEYSIFMKSTLQKAVRILSMQSPQDRLIFFGTLPFAIWIISNLSFMPSLSIYSHLGIPSPSIGLTRAFWRLLSGEFVEAWELNALIYPAVLVTICIVAKDIYTVLKER